MTATETEGYQLSPQQQAVFLREGAERQATHVVRSASAIAPDQIAARLEALVARYEVLRTRYVDVTGLRLPVQVVDPAAPVSIEEHPDGRAVIRANEFSVEHSDSPGGTVLVLALPRLSVDRASWSLLTGALLDDSPDIDSPDSEAPPQYADVSAWLCGELAQSDLAAAAQSGNPYSLPFLRSPGSQDPDSRPEAVSRTLSGAALDRVRAATGKLAVSEAALLLAAWTSLCGRYTRHEGDHVLVLASGRSTPGLDGVLGLLERPVPVRLPVAADDSFAQTAKSGAAALRDALAQEHHQDPNTVRGEGERGISFRYQQDRWAPLTQPGDVAMSELPGVMHLDCVEGPDDLVLTIASRFVPESDLASFANALERFLDDAMARPERAVGLLQLLTPPEPRIDRASRHETALRQFLEHSERFPERPAVRCGDEAVTYRELGQRAAAVAALLREWEIGTGNRVPVLVHTSAGTVAALLGTWLTGAAFVPIDPMWPKGRIETVLRELAPPLILVPDNETSPSFSVEAVSLPIGIDLPELPTADADGPAYVIFTSGTSGTPKGVLVGHAQLAHYATAVRQELGLPEGAGFAAVSTLAADLSYTAIFPTLAGGGCVHLIDADTATSPGALGRRLHEAPVNAMKVVPSHLTALLAEAADPATLLPTDVLVLGGEMLPRSLVERLHELAPNLRIYNHYGPTETTIGASLLRLDTPVDRRCASVPVGAGLGDNLLTVADDEGSPLPPWCPGEVLITGPGVGMGYLNDAGDHASGFGGQGISRYYRSGDLGRVVPGAGIEILGRLDDQVKVRGHRVQLQEIEALLLRQRGVTACAVVARVDGNGLVSHLDAYVVTEPHDGRSITARDLQIALRRRVVPAVVPTGWQLLDGLPLTGSGKVDRRALAPIGARRMLASRPHDVVEQRLLVMWSEVLDIDGISPYADFFDIGGHSVHALKLIARINNTFGCSLPMASVLRARTVTAMAELVRGSKLQDSNLVPLRPAKGDGAPVFCFHPGGGSTLCYWELARVLPENHPVIGVESWGLHGRSPEKDFAEMAENYAAAIVAAGHDRPVLIGWCFGGLVARETALALRRAGHEVAGLILVDCPAPGFDDQDDEGLQEARLLTESTLVNRFAWHFEPELPSEPSRAPTTYELLLKALQTGGHLPSDAVEDDVRTIFAVYTANMIAWESHFEGGGPESPPADHPVLLVRAGPGDLPAEQDRTWGWRSLIGPELSLASIVGDHHSIMRRPGVADLAGAIGRALDDLRT